MSEILSLRCSLRYRRKPARIHGAARAVGLLAAGPQQAAMLLAKSWDLHLLPDKFLAEVDFFRFPVIDPALPVAEIAWVYGYGAPDDAAQAPAVLEFLTYMSSLEAQTLLAQHVGSVIGPVNPKVDPALLKPGQAKGMALLRNADDAVVDPVVAMPQVMWASFESGFRRFMDNPDDIGWVLQRLEEGRQAELKQGLFLE